jgi:phage shock protein A
LQNELQVYQTRLYELQQRSEMLTAQGESAAEVSSNVVSLEKKIAEIKLYLASLQAARSSAICDVCCAVQLGRTEVDRGSC